MICNFMFEQIQEIIRERIGKLIQDEEELLLLTDEETLDLLCNCEDFFEVKIDDDFKNIGDLIDLILIKQPGVIE